MNLISFLLIFWYKSVQEWRHKMLAVNGGMNITVFSSHKGSEKKQNKKNKDIPVETLAT